MTHHNNSLALVVAAICFAALVSQSFAALTLIQVQFVHRHGDRAPINKSPPLYPVDWEKALGVQPSQLTGTGATQAKQLGIWLRQRYIEDSNLISATFNPAEVYVRSTSYDRTIATANAVLGGLFAGTPARFDDIHNITANVTVPVNTILRANDIQLQGYDICGTTKTEIIWNLTTSDVWTDKVASSQEFLTWFKNVTGYPTVVFQNFYDYYDPVFVMYNHNLLPDVIKARIEEIKALAGWTEMTKIGATGKLAGGGFLGSLMTNFESALNTTLRSQTPKFVQWSAHDSTIMSLIVTLELNDNPLFSGIPAYASAVVMELWADDANVDNSRVVMIFRNGVTGDVNTIYNKTMTELRTLANNRALGTPQAWCDACAAWPRSVMPEACLRIQATPTPTPAPASSSDSSMPEPYFGLAIAFIIYSAISTVLLAYVMFCSKRSRKSYKSQGAHTEALLTAHV